jgi:hypothetical protein
MATGESSVKKMIRVLLPVPVTAAMVMATAQKFSDPFSIVLALWTSPVTAVITRSFSARMSTALVEAFAQKCQDQGILALAWVASREVTARGILAFVIQMCA